MKSSADCGCVRRHSYTVTISDTPIKICGVSQKPRPKKHKAAPASRGAYNHAVLIRQRTKTLVTPAASSYAASEPSDLLVIPV